MDMVDFDTYCIARKNPTSSELFLYLEEVDSCCPKCGIPFSRTKDGKFVKGYEIAHVFPNSPTPAEKIMLQNVCIAGINSEDPLNKIALCHDCHKYYDDNTILKLIRNFYRLQSQGDVLKINKYPFMDGSILSININKNGMFNNEILNELLNNSKIIK